MCSKDFNINICNHVNNINLQNNVSKHKASCCQQSHCQGHPLWIPTETGWPSEKMFPRCCPSKGTSSSPQQGWVRAADLGVSGPNRSNYHRFHLCFNLLGFYMWLFLSSSLGRQGSIPIGRHAPENKAYSQHKIAAFKTISPHHVLWAADSIHQFFVAMVFFQQILNCKIKNKTNSKHPESCCTTWKII